jgi:uncharacterized membrane protein YphA (DoxX/SURF4 family)
MTRMSKLGTFQQGCAPVLLRVMLGVTFLWAGAGKVFKDQPYAGADAAALANMGLSLSPTRGAPSAKPSEPAPSTTPTTPPGPTIGTPVLPPPDRILPLPGEKPAEPKPAKPSKRRTDSPVATAITSQAAPGTGGKFTSEDFPAPVERARVYSLALVIHRASEGLAPDGKSISAFWPGWLGSGATPIYLAWSAALAELLAGFGLLVGLFTRTSALIAASVMVGALWLTELGPAWASGNNVLGLIPSYDWWDPKAWSRPLWQLSLLTSSIVLFMLGSGHGSVDRARANGKAKAQADDEGE